MSQAAELETTLLTVATAIVGVALISRISRREREALQLAARGLSNRQIAESMQTTVGTVKGYLHRAYDKLGLVGGRESL